MGVGGRKHYTHTNSTCNTWTPLARQPPAGSLDERGKEGYLGTERWKGRRQERREECRKSRTGQEKMEGMERGREERKH